MPRAGDSTRLVRPAIGVTGHGAVAGCSAALLAGLFFSVHSHGEGSKGMTETRRRLRSCCGAAHNDGWARG
jgi:hypothetical protein